MLLLKTNAFSGACCLGLLFLVQPILLLAQNATNITMGNNESHHHSNSNKSIAENTSVIVPHPVMKVTKCGGPGCPYAGAWLASADLFMRAAWNLNSRKMEEATFSMLLGWTFQTDTDYHVKHLSWYEHDVNKKNARNASGIIEAYVTAAYRGECEKRLDPNGKGFARDQLALIPFYGGIPPSANRSFEADGKPTNGEGHSKMPPGLKTATCMATVCSCLNYFGTVVVGVSSERDQVLMLNALSKLGRTVSQRVFVVLMEMPRPSALPFHLLTWGQRFVWHHNCNIHKMRSAHPQLADDVDFLSSCPLYRDVRNIKNIKLALNFVKHNISHSVHFPKDLMINNVYYTESDQLVYFKDDIVFKTISKASNESVLFLGKRCERNYSPNDLPEEYDKQYSLGRFCGSPGYEVDMIDYKVRYHDPAKRRFLRNWNSRGIGATIIGALSLLVGY